MPKTKIIIEKEYLCPLARVLWLLQPEFLKVTIEKSEKTERKEKKKIV